MGAATALRRITRRLGASTIQLPDEQVARDALIPDREVRSWWSSHYHAYAGEIPVGYGDKRAELPRAPARLDCWPYLPSRGQTLALLSEAPELLFGGQAGPGKSSYLLMMATLYIHDPRWDAMLFRRTYADLTLPGALLDRAREWWLPRGLIYSAATRQFRYPGGGRVSFGYLDRPDDHLRYQGAEWTFLGFDEASQLRPHQMQYLQSRLRQPVGAGFPLLTRYASNPGGEAHSWLRNRFMGGAGDNGAPELGCAYLPAKLEDNPGLDAEEYDRQLRRTDDVTYRQLRYGDWDVQISGGWMDVEKLGVAETLGEGVGVRYWDFASVAEGGDYTVGALVRMRDGEYVIEDIVRGQWSPAEVERTVAQTAARDGQGVRIVLEQEPGSSGAMIYSHYVRRVLSGYSVAADRVTGPKVERAKPLAAAISNGLVATADAPWVEALKSELLAFPEGAHDDQVDAIAGAMSRLSSRQLL